MLQLRSGKTRVFVTESERAMGEEAAQVVGDKLIDAFQRGKRPVLWMMAAPSGFAFYKALVKKAVEDTQLQESLSHTELFQFDDYPINRNSERFPVTFRNLLEEHVIKPLKTEAQVSIIWNPLELTGDEQVDNRVIYDYENALLERLQDDNVYTVEVKGIGMDGHWGFHGAETPLTMEPEVITVPMNTENIYQQMTDWAEYFRSPEDVPAYAVTCNVPLFLLADTIVDLVPQSTKQYSVLATYGTEEVIGDVPSSALKQHPDSVAFITEQAGKALLEFKRGQESEVEYKLNASTMEELRNIWQSDKEENAAQESIRKMEAVLTRLNML